MDHTTSHFGKRTNTHLIAADVTTATDLLVVPIISDNIYIELIQDGDIDANVTINIEVSNNGLDWHTLDDTAGSPIKITWAFADTSDGINLTDLKAAYLKLVLEKGDATDGIISAINIIGTGGEPTSPPKFSHNRTTSIVNNGFMGCIDIDPMYPANVHMEYGVTTAYGSSTTPRRIYGGNQFVNFVATGLNAATEYHWKVVVETIAGTFSSEDNELETLA